MPSLSSVALARGGTPRFIDCAIQLLSLVDGSLAGPHPSTYTQSNIGKRGDSMRGLQSIAAATPYAAELADVKSISLRGSSHARWQLRHSNSVISTFHVVVSQ